MATATQGMPSSGSGSDWSSFLGGAANLAGSIYGSQNAAQDQTQGNRAAIGTFQPQQQIGMGAMNTLGNTLGTSGGPANYSNFLNMPGYQFAVNQGTQAIQRQFAAQGNAYTPNEAAAVGQYVTGTAMQDYNTYINQLLSTSQFGQNANANIGQAQINTGTAQAGGHTAAGGAIGSFLNSPNGSGMINGAVGLVGKGINYLGGLGGGQNNSGVNTGTDASGGYTDASGNYIPGGSNTFNTGSFGDQSGNMNTGYDNSQTNFDQSSGANGGPGFP